ncbi:hypothetical protein LNP05_30030 [Klebsiella pneumoniae subsp. pneumoniae]|nr:hypothetical protein [Klebsiella pneumoniae subsp. pneumoniae]
MNDAADRFKPDAAVLAARIDTAVQRYEVTSTTQRFNAPAPLAMQQLQERILEGWRYDIGIPQSVYLAGTGNMSITLRKPAELVEQEITDLKRQVEDSYHKRAGRRDRERSGQAGTGRSRRSPTPCERKPQPQNAMPCASVSRICC